MVRPKISHAFNHATQERSWILLSCDPQSHLHNFKIEFVDRPISEMLNSSIVDVLG